MKSTDRRVNGFCPLSELNVFLHVFMVNVTKTIKVKRVSEVHLSGEHLESDRITGEALLTRFSAFFSFVPLKWFVWYDFIPYSSEIFTLSLDLCL